MLIARMVIYLALMVVFPYVTGAGFAAIKNPLQGKNALRLWNLGMLIMYTGFEVLALIGTFGHITLKRVTFAWLLLMLGVIAAGGYCSFRRKDTWKRQRKTVQMDRWALVLLILIMAGILYQMIYVCVNMHVDDDDAYYVGMAVTSYFSNTISVYHPYLGTEVPLGSMANYVLSPYPIYCAMWSRLLGIHPAILMRSLLPAVNIAWCYVVYYLLGRTLFQTFSRQMEFLLIVVMAHLLGACSGIAPPVFLSVRVWQGKALLAAVLLPMLWYLWIRIRKYGNEKILWWEMLFAVCASCLSSSMALFLCPVLLGAFGLQYLIEKRSWGNVGRLVLCALPCLSLAIGELYLVYR